MATLVRLDLRKELRHLYAPSASQVEVVEVPAFNFLMLDGKIEPEMAPDTSPAYRNAIGALYSMSYTLKFMSKLSKAEPIDYKVMALEGLWWTDSGEFSVHRKDELRWTMMMLQPSHISDEMVKEALERAKAKDENPALELVRFEEFEEGLCMQIMHIGPYAEEARTVEKMMAFAKENGYELRGKHHEIYLGDPRRSKPDRLKTILRYPIKKR
mgnify:CR=1 FL=1